jgi:hypothetical protein
MLDGLVEDVEGHRDVQPTRLDINRQPVSTHITSFQGHFQLSPKPSENAIRSRADEMGESPSSNAPKL